MSIPRSVADVIKNHVTIEVEGIDRMYINVYQAQAANGKQAAWLFSLLHRGQPVASSLLMGIMTQGVFAAEVDAFVEAESDSSRSVSRKGQTEGLGMSPRNTWDRFYGNRRRTRFLGKAQEKVTVFRTEKRRIRVTGQKYPWIVKAATPVNQFYFDRL